MRATFDHPYPTTKIIWIPDSVSLQLLTSYVYIFLVYNLISYFCVSCIVPFSESLVAVPPSRLYFVAKFQC